MTRKFETAVFPRVYLNPYPYPTSPSTLSLPLLSRSLASLGHSNEIYIRKGGVLSHVTISWTPGNLSIQRNLIFLPSRREILGECQSRDIQILKITLRRRKRRRIAIHVMERQISDKSDNVQTLLMQNVQELLSWSCVNISNVSYSVFVLNEM